MLADGIALGRMMRGLEGGGEDEDSGSTIEGEYFGGKWGIPLRAPDLWFDLVDAFGDRFVPLGELAEIRFGVKSGNDGFFYPKDVSDDCLTKTADAAAFEREYGVARRDVDSGASKLVRCGEKYAELRPIESCYLEPEVHSLMEVKGYIARAEECGRMILLVGEPKAKLKGTWAGKYIEWGEKKGWHKSATCGARATDERGWYDLTGHARGVMFWPKAQQYKHSAPRNSFDLQANCNLYDLHPAAGIDADVLAGPELFMVGVGEIPIWTSGRQ